MSRFTTRRAIAGSILAAAALVGTAGVAHAAFGFDDVEANDTHAGGIQWLVNNGITTGCDADSYCPQQPVTRAQMATFCTGWPATTSPRRSTPGCSRATAPPTSC